MSGGHFNYKQRHINDIADEVEDVLSMSSWYGDKFTNETIMEFKNGLKALRVAAIYIQRIDWLLSGDDGEDSFHERLAADLKKVE